MVVPLNHMIGGKGEFIQKTANKANDFHGKENMPEIGCIILGLHQ
jgi:hypothetical protein